MIVVRIWEGLGNQLFQYAFAKALQMRTGKTVRIDTNRMFIKQLEGRRIARKYSLDNFNISLQKAYDCENKYFFLKQENIFEELLYELSNRNYLPSFYKETSLEYKPQMKTVADKVYLMGWFQDERYFIDYRDTILQEIKPIKQVNISQHLLNILLDECTVSVHIRRGDFTAAGNTLSLDYYNKARKIMEKKYDNPYYIIFSDDPMWVKKTYAVGSRAYFVSDEKLQDFDELYIMSLCKNNIIANSTFSWWGAWLNQNPDKIVIGPTEWFKYKKINIMPEAWIKI